jgi:hypothetical protein
MDSTIERKLSAGLLPRHRPVKSWAGFGTGETCDGCDQPILATEVEHELDFAESLTLRFHTTCEQNADPQEVAQNLRVNCPARSSNDAGTEGEVNATTMVGRELPAQSLIPGTQPTEI